MILPKLKVNFNPFIVYSSGRPFNIVTGRDTNGDGLFHRTTCVCECANRSRESQANALW